MIETRTIAVDGCALAVHCAGEGPVALLVHGYPFDHRMWLDTLRSPLSRERTLCAVDLRGHGGSPWAGDPVHAMERFADDLAGIACTLSEEPVDLVGLSMGGYAALAFAERHAGLLRSLALVDTKAAADSDAGKEARRAAAQNVLQHGRRWLADQMLPKLVAPDAAATVRARVQTMIEATPVETVLADLEGMRVRPDRHDALARLQAPVFVCRGELDAIATEADCAAMAKAATRATTCTVPGAGHVVPMERPTEFEAALGAFWRAR